MFRLAGAAMTFFAEAKLPSMLNQFREAGNNPGQVIQLYALLKLSRGLLQD